MTRDNLLFALIGLLAGFISGYFVQEAMAARQATAVPQAMGGQPAAMANSPAAGGAPMAEVQRLRQRLAENPNDADAMLTLANMNYDIRNWQNARDLYQRYLKLRPADPDVLTDLAVTLRELGNFQEAMTQLEQAQQLDHDHWQSLFNEVVIFAFDLKQPEKAKAALERLQKLQPDNPDVARLADQVKKGKMSPAGASSG